MSIGPARAEAFPGARSPHPLAGNWLFLVRVAWLVVFVLDVGLFVLAAPIELATETTIGETRYLAPLADLGLSPTFYGIYITAWYLALPAAFAFFGALIFLRKSDDGFVALVSIGCVTVGAFFVPTLTRLATAQPVLALPIGGLRALGLALALIGFYYLMPDGRFAPRWTLWPSLAWVGLVIVWLLFPQAPANVVSLRTWDRDRTLEIALYLLAFGSGIYAQIYRYRRVSRPVERQQMKWVIFGVTAAIVGFVVYYVPLAVDPIFADGSTARLIHLLALTPVFLMLVALAPAAIAISVLRFKLWDVDTIISRTLVYGSLTIGLVVVYFGGVILLQQLFIAFTGQQSDLALVASTLSIAAAFDPLRQTLQRAVDRRFYRRRYDAMQVLMSVGDTIREEVDLDNLTERLVSAVDEAMQPARVGIWLVRPEAGDRTEAVGAPSELG